MAERRLIDLWGVNMDEVDTSDCTDVEDILSAVITYLSELPTVDAVEVVHGRWVKKWHDNNLIGHEYEECSVCGSCVISDTEKFWDCNYCPNCGAKMDGGGTDGSEG